MKYIINTDGGARGNPGPAGVGFVIADGAGSVIKESSVFIGTSTNNAAEYQALLEAFKEAKKVIGKDASKTALIEVRMDSELIVKQLNGEYQISEETLFPYFIAVHNLRVKDFPNVRFVHIRREANKRADELANEAMDRGK
jgi:ribonuclease HI